MTTKKENETGLWIGGDLASRTGLSGNELIIYACIYNFSQDNKSKYFGSITWLAENFNISRKTAQNILARLVDKGFIYKYVYKGNNVCYAIYDDGTAQKTNELEEISTTQQEKSTIVKSTTDVVISSPNVVDSTTPSNIKENKVKVNTLPLTEVPTYTQIQEYCQEKDYHFDIDYFIYYWGERNWCRYDKNLKKYIPIKDWKGTIRTWARNETRYAKEEKYKEAQYQSRKTYVEKNQHNAKAIEIEKSFAEAEKYAEMFSNKNIGVNNG